MLDIEALGNPTIVKLMDEAESLGPKLIIRVMTDERLLKESAGAAVTTSSDGVDTVHLDPPRANAHAVAHELMHVILHRSGFPRVSAIAPSIHAFGVKVADTIDNIVDHCAFYPRLVSHDIDTHPYWDTYIRSIGSSQLRSDVGAVSQASFAICDIMNSSPDNKKRVLMSAKACGHDALRLARALYKACEPARAGSPASARRAMVDMLKTYEAWFATKVGELPHSTLLIGISPLLSEATLDMPAVTTTDFVSEGFCINDQYLWVSYVRLKRDRSIIAAWVAPGAKQEPNDTLNLKTLWARSTLRQVIKASHWK